MKSKIEGLEIEGSVSEFVELVLALRNKTNDMVDKPEPVIKAEELVCFKDNAGADTLEPESVVKASDYLKSKADADTIGCEPDFPDKSVLSSKPIKFYGTNRHKSRMETLSRIMFYAHKHNTSYFNANKINGSKDNLSGLDYRIIRKLAKKNGFNPDDVKNIRSKRGGIRKGEVEPKPYVRIVNASEDFLKEAVVLAHKEGINYTRAVKRISGRKGINGFERKFMRNYARSIGLNPLDCRYKHNRARNVVKTSNRMSFIHNKIKSLTNLDKGLSYEKAFIIASDEWNKFKNDGLKAEAKSIAFSTGALIKEPEVKVFPSFVGVDDRFRSILETGVKNMLTTGIPLDFFEFGYAVGIDSLKVWRDFIADFIVKSSLVASFFGVANRFVVTDNNKIAYGGINNG